MSLTCEFRKSENEIEIITATDYVNEVHRGRIFDKFTGASMYYRKGHQRFKKLTYKVQAHFVSQYQGDFPDHLEFNSEYFRNSSKYSYKESMEHLAGKKFVRNQLLKSGDLTEESIQYEHLVKLPNGKYRIIDVAIVLPYGEIYAYEIQLASITPEELEKRSEDYRLLGIDVTWFLGGAADTTPNQEWHFDYLGIYAPILSFTRIQETYVLSDEEE
jgi:hypothetical protein